MISLDFRCIKLLFETHHLFYICAAFSQIIQIYLQAEMRTRLRLYRAVFDLISIVKPKPK